MLRNIFYGTNAETVLGEILLYIFMEQELDAPKIMSRIELDEYNRGVVSKSDGVHLLSLNRTGQPFHQLVFGASDIVGDLSAAVDRAFDKIINIEANDDCYLADLIVRGVAYHVGYLPANIRLRIERSFENGDLRTIFCTSTLIEGVNLPADNLFITSYRNGPSNMNEVEFKNLIGRVGRIKYNLYGNVVLVREDDKLKEDQYCPLRGALSRRV